MHIHYFFIAVFCSLVGWGLLIDIYLTVRTCRCLLVRPQVRPLIVLFISQWFLNIILKNLEVSAMNFYILTPYGLKRQLLILRSEGPKSKS